MYFKRISVLLFGILSVLAQEILSAQANDESMLSSSFSPLQRLTRLHAVNISQEQLPKPYDFLLTQPLMTPGLEHYYQRTGKIKIIKVVRDRENNTYSRVITMVMDSDKQRNNATIAERRKEAMTVELALITINFNELSEKIIAAILTSNVPFGTLLLKNNIPVYDSDRQYFTIRCDEYLMKWLHCKLGSRLYGRTHLLRKKENDAWIASVMEILPCLQGSGWGKRCH
ncbi:hypothetical protein [Legionella oakridgensis]|uniref:Uncharacterized protein n=2 Tax=Legionella oakridgensis TaxID=29423 RepID=W0B5W0_9GAMM|nr:hypothetical protein [Legionella oakridgensis]AHE65903.1 hypothetical protein Loa_00314 [Legionella oakridgensis ATCC 33761 = DSM 21215]ETO94334.1 hypothetical protein LOR_76c22040 [Legionella oakridgensis RV-2-2007]KTD43757.1 hypothetical protein Loak_0307 [Legionella oakridgensis]STY15834.1 Uncharacterised protein [Legionella longbeachae]